MQFIGKPDASFYNGSEQIYLPNTTWRSTTTISGYLADYTDGTTKVTYNYPSNPAVVIAYGPYRGDATKGMVMMEVSHYFKSGGCTIESQVASERAFFNFVLLAGYQKQITITNASSVFPTSLIPNTQYNLDVNITGAQGAVTYLWSAVGGGTFSTHQPIQQHILHHQQ